MKFQSPFTAAQTDDGSTDALHHRTSHGLLQENTLLSASHVQENTLLQAESHGAAVRISPHTQADAPAHHSAFGLPPPRSQSAASVAIFWNITVLAAGVVNVIFDQTKDAFGDEEAWQAGIISQICIASVGLLGSLVARCCVSQHVGFATPRERLLLAVLCTSATFAGYGTPRVLIVFVDSLAPHIHHTLPSPPHTARTPPSHCRTHRRLVRPLHRLDRRRRRQHRVVRGAVPLQLSSLSPHTRDSSRRVPGAVSCPSRYWSLLICFAAFCMAVACVLHILLTYLLLKVVCSKKPAPDISGLSSARSAEVHDVRARAAGRHEVSLTSQSL